MRTTTDPTTLKGLRRLQATSIEDYDRAYKTIQHRWIQPTQLSDGKPGNDWYRLGQLREWQSNPEDADPKGVFHGRDSHMNLFVARPGQLIVLSAHGCFVLTNSWKDFVLTKYGRELPLLTFLFTITFLFIFSFVSCRVVSFRFDRLAHFGFSSDRFVSFRFVSVRFASGKRVYNPPVQNTGRVESAPPPGDPISTLQPDRAHT